MEYPIEGQNVLITGGASGLGAAYVETFIKYGAKKVAFLDVAVQKGKHLEDKLNQTYKNKAMFIKCDVSREEEIISTFAQVLNKLKGLDVIVNNAGIMNDSPDVWRTANDVNWNGVVSFAMKGIQHMRKDEGGNGGTIINISSVAGFMKFDILPIYCGSKSAVLHYGRCISSPEFFSDSGVRILTICFGPTDTPLFEDLEDKTFDNTTSKKSLAKIVSYNQQTMESAVNAFIKMYREGNPGSIWFSSNNKPGLDITREIDAAFQPLEALYMKSYEGCSFYE